MNLLFYIPYLYTSKTRLGKKGRLLSYFIIIVFPQIYFAILQAPNWDFQNLMLILLAVILIQNNYELGYIQNDTETILKEDKPTIRLSDSELNYYRRYKPRIYLIRVLVSLILAGLISLICIPVNLNWFYLISIFLLAVFQLYNSIRSSLNLHLHFLLTIIKYSAVQFLFLNTFNVVVFTLSIFAFPLINFIDRAATPRFSKRLSTLYTPKVHKYRMYYYLSLFVICSFLYLFKIVSLPLLGIAIYYFVYRLTIYLKKLK